MSDLPTLSENKFYYQGQRLLLTYAGHLDKDALCTFVEAQAKLEPDFIRAAHEVGNSTGVAYPHTHVGVDFGKRFQSRDCRRFDWKSPEGVVHPQWRSVKTKAHWRNVLAYLAKEDPDNEDLIVTSCVSAIWSAPTIQDALLDSCRSPADALGVIALYGARPAESVVVDLPDRPWHQEALALVASPPDRRAIHWFYDAEGNSGKTWLARYCMSRKLAYFVKQCGGSHHFATVIQGALAAGWDQRCFIFDFPRGTEDHSFYGPLEEVKDGCVTALKYQGGTLLFRQPHVLVFANFLPRREKLSKDRWWVHEILPDHTLKRPILRIPRLGLTPASYAVGESGDLTLSIQADSTSRPVLSRQDNLAVGGVDLSDAEVAEILADLL